MKPERRRTGWLALEALLLLVAFAPIAAQREPCPPFVLEAITEAQQVCGTLGRNQVCYGHNHVVATDFAGAEVADFALPGNLADVLNLGALTTFPLDETDQTWGVAMLALQANVPDSLPGQNVTFVLFGDVALQNDVKPGDIVAANTALGTANASPNIRLGPGRDWAILGSLAAGESISLIGQTEAGDWLQFLHEGDPAWVAQQFIDVAGDRSVLPVASADSDPLLYSAPMQAFRFQARPGAGTECAEVPGDGMVIQAPQSATVNFLVNGIELSVGSTALLREQAEGDGLQVATLAGSVGVKSEQYEQIIQPGYITEVAEGAPPAAPERYEYEEVRALPLDLLPEAVNAPPPVGTEVSAFICNTRRDGVLPTLVSKEQPIIFTEPLGGSNAASAALAREVSNVRLTLDGEAVPLWGISEAYETGSSVNAATGQTGGSAVLQDWWFVVPYPEPGRHLAVLTWVTATVAEYRCAFTVQ